MEALIQPLVDKSGFTLEELRSECRSARMVIIRQILFLYLRNIKGNDGNYKYTYQEIGSVLNRHHATVIHGVKNAKSLISINDTMTMIFVNKIGLKVHKNIL